MSYTDHIPYQCSDIDEVIGSVETGISELDNVEGHVETAREMAEEIQNREDDDFDIQEIKDIAGCIVDEMNDADIDKNDGVTSLEGLSDTMEGIRTACEQLRSVPDSVAESMYEDFTVMESRAEDAEEKAELLELDNEVLTELVEKLRTRNGELERLVNPMIPIPFKTVGPADMERWEAGL